MHYRWVVVAMMTSLAAACGKKEASPADVAAPRASTAESAATSEPAAASAPTPATDLAAPAAEQDPELLARREAVEFAMLEDGYKNDPKGQWAVTATASSSYAGDDAAETAGWHPMRATGAPDTESYGDKTTAWATRMQDLGIEWLELTFARPVRATELRIRQNFNPGAIIKVELYDEAGKTHRVWQGPDTTKYPPSQIAWLTLKFEPTAYKTQRARLTLATNAVPGWNEIDAVQLVGE